LVQQKKSSVGSVGSIRSIRSIGLEKEKKVQRNGSLVPWLVGSENE
jgi:hypothetical protein